MILCEKFGKCAGGGRRQGVRERLLLPAMLLSIGFTKAVLLEDVSRTGAKLSGSSLPARGCSVWLRVNKLELFATVAWSRANACGVTFEEVLSERELKNLKHEWIRYVSLTPQQRLAVDDWISGVAR